MLKGEYFKWVAALIIFYLTVGGMFIRIHQYFQVFMHTVLLVYLGCVFSAKVFDYKNKDRELETMKQKDALMFPIIGSCVLFGLSLLFKYFNKDYVNILFHYYFSIIGAYSIGGMIYERITSCSCFAKYTEKKILTVPEIKWINPKPVSFDILDLVCFALGSVIAFGYFMYKNWVFNNILGITFSIFGIENLMLGQFKVGFILLGLLFFYDIFWVFFTGVMESVAKNLDGPIKLMFPKNLEWTNEIKDFNMIGLGDIVIPGVFVALMLRYDMFNYMRKHKTNVVPFSLANCKYFFFTLFGYTMGIIVTLFVMVVFQRAQPALLYLVPGCLFTSVGMALWNKEFKELWDFNEETAIEELRAKKE